MPKQLAKETPAFYDYNGLKLKKNPPLRHSQDGHTNGPPPR